MLHKKVAEVVKVISVVKVVNSFIINPHPGFVVVLFIAFKRNIILPLRIVGARRWIS